MQNLKKRALWEPITASTTTSKRFPTKFARSRTRKASTSSSSTSARHLGREREVVLKLAGTLVTCGATTGPNVAIDLRHLIRAATALLGSYMGTDGRIARGSGPCIRRTPETGRRPNVSAERHPLPRTSIWRMSQMFGKIVVNPDGANIVVIARQSWDGKLFCAPVWFKIETQCLANLILAHTLISKTARK